MSEHQRLLLSVTDLHKHYPVRKGQVFAKVVDHVAAVNGISFTINEGETLGLVGESGSGKSTTGYAILQLIEPTAGSVVFDGQELVGLKPRRIRELRRHFQIVFQDPYTSLNPRMTIGTIIREPLEIHKRGTRAFRRRRMLELLDIVGLSATHVDRYPHEFSGGQRQRVGIARALALEPQLIVCDEPVSALDVSVQAQILNLLKDIQETLGLAYLFIAHDLAVVRVMSDRVIVMQHGEIAEEGDAEMVYAHPQHPYTKALLSAVTIPDPRRMQGRRAERRKGGLTG